MEPQKSKPKVDKVTFERRQRQFLNELAMKRDQVEELKKELDAANLKTHELTRALDSAKRTAEEHQYNLNLALNNARFFEDQLQANRDSIMKSRVQQELAATEKENLKELLQKSELQNYNLTQELNELKAQHSCDVAYQKDLVNRDAKIRSRIAEITETMSKLQIDQNVIAELSDKVQTIAEMQKTIHFYRQQFYKSKENYAKIEEKFIFANAALEKFQKLATENDKLFHTNPAVEIIMTQWQKASKRFDDQTKIQKEIIENLTESLRIEKEANVKIFMVENELEKKNDKLLKENQELKHQLFKDHKDIEVQTDDLIILHNKKELVKTETIEILEDN